MPLIWGLLLLQCCKHFFFFFLLFQLSLDEMSSSWAPSTSFFFFSFNLLHVSLPLHFIQANERFIRKSCQVGPPNMTWKLFGFWKHRVISQHNFVCARVFYNIELIFDIHFISNSKWAHMTKTKPSWVTSNERQQKRQSIDGTWRH